jgi:hypothetical protein
VVHATPSPLLNQLMLLTEFSDQELETSLFNKWLIVPSNKETSDAMEVTHMHASTMSKPTVSPPGLLTHTLESPENAKSTEVHSKSPAIPMYPKTTAMTYKLPLLNNPLQFALMPKPGNSINQESSPTVEPNSTTAS